MIIDVHDNSHREVSQHFDSAGLQGNDAFTGPVVADFSIQDLR